MPDFTDPGFYALTVVSILFLTGFLASFLPILPGIIIIWAGIVIHKLWMGPLSLTWLQVGIATLIMGITLLADYVFTAGGAKRFGASWRGGAGAILGGIVALFIPPQLFTLIIGPFLGAVLAELLGGNYARGAFRAGVGTIIGGILAFGLKFSLGITLILGFYLLLP